MKILNREKFLACPIGTVFFDFKPTNFTGLAVKMSGPEDAVRASNDFFRINIDSILNVGTVESGESSNGTNEALEMLDRAVVGAGDFGLFFDCMSRDGMYEDDAMFVVFDDADVQRLVAALTLGMRT